jgi:hypothetical protein
MWQWNIKVPTWTGSVEGDHHHVHPDGILSPLLSKDEGTGRVSCQTSTLLTRAIVPNSGTWLVTILAGSLIASLIREAWRQAAITASSEAEFRLVDVEVLQLVGVVDELPYFLVAELFEGLIVLINGDAAFPKGRLMQFAGSEGCAPTVASTVNPSDRTGIWPEAGHRSVALPISGRSCAVREMTQRGSENLLFSLWGAGPINEARLAEIGVLTIGQLAKTPGLMFLARRGTE